MPLTFSHPAAVVPFARKGLPLSALVIGSMSPDFIYFIRLAPRGAFTHTAEGVLLFCLPVSLLVLWLYHALLKMPLISLLPCPLQEELLASSRQFRFLPLRRMAVLIASILIGASTHVVWDGFTHENGWALQWFPFLSVTVMDLGFDQIPLTRILQHTSSVVGGVWLVILSRKWMVQTQKQSEDKILCKEDSVRTVWKIGLMVFGSAALGLLYAWSQEGPVVGYRELRRMMVLGVVTSGTAFFSITFLYSVLWHLGIKRTPPERDPV